MSKFSEIMTTSSDPRRIELAKLLATAVIRLLTRRLRDEATASLDSEENSPAGLEES